MNRKLGPAYSWRYQIQRVEKLPQKGSFLVARHIYTFYTDNTQGGNAKKYNLEVHQYEDSIYILKFYLAAHAQHPNRYNILTNVGFRDARRILDTCFHVMADILKRDPLASGGFIGAPKPLKVRPDKHKPFRQQGLSISKRKLEKEAENQRYRVYTRLATNYFSPDNWDHYDYSEKSVYLLVNRRNPKSNIHQVAWDLYNALGEVPQNERTPFPLRVIRRNRI
ncbi:MAG: hypothetical protein EOO61_13785 [Hymenobacter sp.]|nr:MAG: hypothetical protein EOO61_13785 [Hymenobacter sp.]